MSNTTPTADDLDAFVRNYRANAKSASSSEDTSDDLDAFVRSYQTQPPPLPAGYFDVDATSAQSAKPPLPPGYYDVEATSAQTGKPPIPPGYYDADGATGGNDLEASAKYSQAAPRGIPRTPPTTISPRTPTVMERIKNALTFGAPPGSTISNVSGKVMQPGDEQREPGLSFESAMTPTEQREHPYATGVAQLASGLTTPENVLLTAGTAGFGTMPGAAGAILPRLLSAGFSAQALKGAYDAVPEIKAAWDRGDFSEVKRLMTIAVGSAAMGVAAGAHAVKGAPVAAEAPNEAPAEAPKENLVPESPQTLATQTDALANGTNPVVYFPKGTESLPEPPANAQVTVVPGENAGSGTYYHDQSVTPDQINKAVSDGTYGQLLGHVQSKAEATAPGTAPTVLTARAADGTEAKASVVDGSKPEIVAQQAAVLARQFPDSKIGVERPEDVITGRKATPTEKETAPVKSAVSTETPASKSVPQEGEDLDSFVQNHRAPDQTKFPVGDYAPKLKELSGALRESDPELSRQLAGLANGDPSALDGLRKYAQDKLPSEQSAPLIASIDAAAKEDREAAPESAEANRVNENFKTSALQDLIGHPVDRTSGGIESEDELDRFVRNYRPEGTFNAGFNPVSAAKRIIPESVRERVGEEVDANQRARRLQGGLYDLDSQAAADLIRARNVLKEAPGTAADQEAIYHHLEDPSKPLTPTQRGILNGYLRPLLDESERINAKLGGGEVENYVHRIPVGKGNMLDRALGGEGKIGSRGRLSTGASSTKGRTMMALEDEAGNRRVVAIKGGQVTGFDNGNPETLGRLRLRSKGDLLSHEIEPMQRELDRLQTERRTLTATKGRETSASRRVQHIDTRAAELREAIQDTHRTDDGRLLSENELRNRAFVDKSGKQWKITQVTTREIEAQTGVRYYKNAIASATLNFLNIRNAERAHDFLEQYKSSPDFQEAAVKINGNRVPAGWRGTDLPQFHGYAFGPHTAEVLDWYAKRLRAEGPSVYTQLGNFLRTSIFFNPLIHTPNIGVHWIVEKGLTAVGPQNWGRILRTGSRAIDAVIHQNSDFLEALDEGAPLQSARLDNGVTTRLLVERMGKELEANATAAQKVAKALGYANPAKLVKAVYDFSGKATWVTNDIAMLQAAYEHMDRTGSSFKEAIGDVSKHIPDYRLPTRILNSPALAKIMSNPNLTMFGSYHYGALRSYAEMAKGLISDDIPSAERAKSLDRLAMLGLVTFVAYPKLDKLAKLLTGDKTAEFRRAGASTFIWNLAQLARGNRTPTEVLESVATPAAHTKAAAELALNRNLYTGRKIYDPNAPAGEIAQQVGKYASNTISPVQQASRVAEGRQTIPQFAAGLAGIRTNVKTPAERLASSLVLDRMPLTPPKPRANGTPSNSQTPPLVRDFKRLPIEDGLKVWAAASDAERQTLRPLLEAKASNLDRAKYTPAEWKALSGKIRSAITGAVPKEPTAFLPGSGATSPQPGMRAQ